MELMRRVSVSPKRHEEIVLSPRVDAFVPAASWRHQPEGEPRAGTATPCRRAVPIETRGLCAVRNRRTGGLQQGLDRLFLCSAARLPRQAIAIRLWLRWASAAKGLSQRTP
jgi:hypothetical protein